jgi:hypothetical protein
MQSVGETHETPESDACPSDPVDGMTLQLEPFQDSETGAMDTSLPTAIQDDAVEQEIAASHPPSYPSGVWIGSVDHDFPFQPSAEYSDGLLLVVSAPTATHFSTAAHEMASSAVDEAEPGVISVVHFLPFHPIAMAAWEPVLWLLDPTAAHEDREMQETAARASPWEPWGFGVCRTRHLAPFQVSERVTVTEPERSDPTARHSPEVHETPSSSLNLAAEGAGTVWNFSSFPFQASANGVCGTALLEYEPTTSHRLDDAHETAWSCASLAPFGIGTGTFFHLDPFQSKANATAPELPKAIPTARQKPDFGQETPRSSPPGECGTGFKVHTAPFQSSAIAFSLVEALS